ncbi:MAG: DUF4012 domain-containing protein, partial [Patescibacteria group bacterium]
MPQDLFHIDIKKIPPRRSRSRVDGVNRRRVVKSKKADYAEPVVEALPEFDFAPAEDFVYQHDQAYQADLVSASDPLTDMIFQGADEASALAAQISETNIRPLVPSGRMFGDSEIIPSAPPAGNISKEALMAELARVEDRDIQLEKSIARLETPRRFGHIDLAVNRVNDAAFIEEISVLSPDQEKLISESEPDYASDSFQSPHAEALLGQAENDWFRVSLARDLAPMKSALRLGPHRSSFKTFLAVLAVVIVPAGVVAFMLLGGPEVFKNRLSGFGSKIISASSYTLVNSGAESAFPGVSAIKKGLAAGSEATALIDQFLIQNADFGWLNIFKKKIAADLAEIKGLDLLEQAQSVLAASDLADVKASAGKLKDNLLWFEFWQGLVNSAPAGDSKTSASPAHRQYLVVVLDEASSRPMAGRPLNYTLVKLEDGGLSVASSGKFSDLDAASAQKIIPPRPLQVFSTAWLPGEAGWFWNFEDSAQTLLDFFENTTQLKADGLIAITQGFLKDFSFRQNLLFNADSPNWFYGLSEALARKPENKWPALTEVLVLALEQHRLQFYFRDAEIKRLVAARNWSLAPGLAQNEDGLGVTWANLQGGGINLDLWENSGSVFEDGSVVVKSNIFFKQSGVLGSKNYVKIYLPLGAQVLKAEGFSSKEKIPDFDYAGQGFTVDTRLSVVQEPPAVLESNKLVEIYQESSRLVLGGWVLLNPQERRLISIEYVSPLRLDYSAGVA